MAIIDLKQPNSSLVWPDSILRGKGLATQD